MDYSVDGESITDPRTGIWQHKNVVEVEGDHYVLDDVRKIPIGVYNKAMLGKVEYEETVTELGNINLDYLEQVEKVKDDELKADLVKRNYDDWDKWVDNVYRQTHNIMVNVDYGLNKFTSTVINADVTKGDDKYLNFRKYSIIWTNIYQKDINFEN